MENNYTGLYNSYSRRLSLQKLKEEDFPQLNKFHKDHLAKAIKSSFKDNKGLFYEFFDTLYKRAQEMKMNNMQSWVDLGKE